MEQSAMGSVISAVEFANVLPGARALRADERGAEECYVGLIEVGGDQLRAYIKVLTGRQICNELVGTVAGRAIGLPIPRAFLAQASAAVLPDSEMLKRHGGPAVVFASEALPHPDLSRRLLSDEAYVITWMLKNWKGWEEALAFDEWLANVDRNWRNLLLASDGRIWLIDHGRALTGPTWKAADLVYDRAFTNSLATGLLPNLTLPQRVQLTRSAQTSVSRLSELDVAACIKAARAEMLLAAPDAQAIGPFLTARIGALVSLVCDRMGIPQLGAKR